MLQKKLCKYSEIAFPRNKSVMFDLISKFKVCMRSLPTKLINLNLFRTYMKWVKNVLYGVRFDKTELSIKYPYLTTLYEVPKLLSLVRICRSKKMVVGIGD
jgi:hypothetical protein